MAQRSCPFACWSENNSPLLTSRSLRPSCRPVRRCGSALRSPGRSCPAESSPSTAFLLPSHFPRLFRGFLKAKRKMWFGSEISSGVRVQRRTRQEPCFYCRHSCHLSLRLLRPLFSSFLFTFSCRGLLPAHWHAHFHVCTSFALSCKQPSDNII